MNRRGVPHELSHRVVRSSARSGNYLEIYGRLADGYELQAAIGQLDTDWRLGAEYPDTYDEAGMTAQSIIDYAYQRSRETLYLLAGAVGLILLITCVNVANLMGSVALMDFLSVIRSA